MPITFTLDHDLGLIRTRVTGKLTTDDTLSYFKDIASHPGVPNAAIEIVDFSEVTDFVLDYAQMHYITKEYQPAKATREIIATIFCCPSALAFGIGRMLETLHDIANPNHTVRLVRSQSDVEQNVSELRSHK